MSEGSGQNDDSRNSGRMPGRGRARALWLIAGLMAALLLLGGALVWRMSGAGLPLPGWAQARIEAALSEAWPEGPARLGGARLSLGPGRVPVVTLTEIRLATGGGADGSGAEAAERAFLPRLSVSLDRAAALRGELRPTGLDVAGARLALVRREDGTIDAVFGAATGAEAGLLGASGAIPDLVALLERMLERGPLGDLTEIDISGLAITLDDRRAGRSWRLEDGALALSEREDAFRGTLSARLVSADRPPALARLSFVAPADAGRLRLEARLAGIASQDLAAEVGALGWLALIDAPLMAALDAELGPGGEVAAFSGAIDVGAGTLPWGGADPAPRFERARLELSYAPEAGRLSFREITLATDALRLSARGHADLWGMGVDRSARTADGLILQLRLGEGLVDPPGLLPAPLRIEGGALEARLHLDGPRLEIGQVVIVAPDTTARARGEIAAEAGGLRAALDFGLDRLDRDGLMARWPEALLPGTRDWMARNIDTMRLSALSGALRLQPDEAARFALRFDFDGLSGRYVAALPPLEEGRGHGNLTERRLDLTLIEGQATPPRGGPIALGGSTFSVPDITVAGAPAEVRLATESSLEAVLSLLDIPPFGYPSAAGIDVGLAEGRAETRVALDLPLIEGLLVSDVVFAGEGVVRDVVSESLVPGHRLSAPELRASLDAEGLRLSGQGAVSGVPVSALWEQRFGPGEGGRSRLEGHAELSPRALAAFGIDLPPGSVAGSGRAAIALDLEREAPPRLRLLSDLAGLELTLPGLGWAKPARATGQLEVEATLGPRPDVQRLSLSAPGLLAEGQVRLVAGGGLEEARFERVRLGGWADVALSLRPGPGGVPALSVTGGRLDLTGQGAPGAGGGGGTPAAGGAGGAGGPVLLRLERVTLTEGIALTAVEGEIDTRRGLRGSLLARVNGAAPVRVTLSPTAQGTGARMQSSDGGAVLEAAGLFRGFRGGTLDVALLPSQRAGQLVGGLSLRDTRLVGAPAMAELLSAASIVGLIDQLGGEGISFTEVEAQFRIGEGAVELARGSAIGPSLGFSMEGLYRTGPRTLDMQGVVTPLYMVNSALEQSGLFGGLFGARRGEGIFGVSYRMTGPVDAPRVAVNPLSLLTPGLFREIFRRPPPGIGQ